MCFKILQDSRLGKEQSQANLSVSTVQPVTEAMLVSRRFFVSHLNDKYSIATITREGNPMDTALVLTSKVELDRLAPELVYPADWYIEHLWDCEDYALQGQLDAGRKFQFSARMCTGWTALGYHAFLLTLDTDSRLWLLENNAGFPWAGRWLAPALDTHNLTGEVYYPMRVFI